MVVPDYKIGGGGPFMLPGPSRSENSTACGLMKATSLPAIHLSPFLLPLARRPHNATGGLPFPLPTPCPDTHRET